MKKRVVSAFLALWLLLGIFPARVLAGAGLTEICVEDTVTGNYSLTDVDTGSFGPFELEIPEDGVAVLIFYGTVCVNSQNLFSELNQSDWVKDERVRIYAVENWNTSLAQVRQFRADFAPDLSDAVRWYDTDNNYMLSGCWRACGLPVGTVISPVVMVLSRMDGVNYFRRAGVRVTDAAALGDEVLSLCDADPDQPTEAPEEMVDLTVAGMIDYDAARYLVNSVNDLRRENGAAKMNWNETLTELAAKWAAGTPLQEETPIMTELPALPDGTDAREYLHGALPEAGDFLYICLRDDDLGGKVLATLERQLDYLCREIYTQIGVGCYQTADYCYWTVFITKDLEDNGPVTRTGTEYRDYSFPCPLDMLPVFEGPRSFSPYLYLGQTRITHVDVKSMKCIRDEWGILRPYRISREICDYETGELIATAEDWKDGVITVTGVSPGIGILEIWAYEGQTEPLKHAIQVLEEPYEIRYNAALEVVGNGTAELSTENSFAYRHVTMNIQPDYRWELMNLSIESEHIRYDPIDICLSEQEDGSYTFRMPEMDVRILAEFEYISEYPVTTCSSGMGEVAYHTGEQEPGEHTVIWIRPEQGYMVGSLEWVGEPEDWSWDENHECIFFTMPEHAVELHVTFVDDPEATEGVYEGLYWRFDGVGLMISGQDEIHVPINGGEGPWARFLEEIEILDIGDGTTAICDYAFTHFPNVEIVNIPRSVTSIGREILRDFPSLWQINTSGNPECDPDAFLGQEHLLHSHRYTHGNILEPTCTEMGWTPLYCECGYVSRTDLVPALGHDYVNGICTRCGEYDPDFTTENPFGDVQAQDYFYAPVLWAVEGGITSGTGAGTFSPNASCTRAQVVTFLWRAVGQPEPETTENPFTDVKESDYFYKAVLWAKESGVTSGRTATTFAPNDPCTRDQVVTFLWRAMGQPAPEKQDNPFTDVASGIYYYEPVLWAVENGITSGTSATTFAPSNPCTRAQVVTFLYRALKDK